jgi:hypothetical protein
MLKLLTKVLESPFASGATAKPVRAPGAPKEPAATRLSSSAERVHGLLQSIGARRVLIHADRGAFDAAAAAFAGMACSWASNDLGEIEAGAPNVEDIDWKTIDAAVCAGAGLPRRYRQLLRLMASADAAKPVLWIGESFEFCGGTLSAPAGADAVEGLLFNHFDAFFGVKDALQFRIEVYHGPEMKRYFRILKPNESHVIRLADHFPEARHPVSLAAFVEHPVLTRDRHYRLRLCGDVFWKDSLTTLHSAHEFNRSPNHAVEFRLPAWLLKDGEVALTLPNFDRLAPSGAEVETVVGAKTQKVARDTRAYLDQSVLQRDGTADDAFVGWRYRGFGGSNWFVISGAAGLSGLSASIAGNHHASCPVVDRGDFAAGAEDMARYEKLERDGFVLEPHAVPILPEGNELAFGFEADGANPALKDYRVDFFDGAGRHLGLTRFRKQRPGVLFPADLLALWGDPGAAEARLLMISNDWLKAKLRFKGFKPMANLIVKNRRTGDQDITEFQSSWRNLGIAVPGFPHWLTDDLAVIGRTNVFGRARCDRGLRTGVIAVNASGRLGYHRPADASITVLDNAGRPLTTEFKIPAFTWKLIWLDEVMPLAAHLGESGNGALLVKSADADLNCQIVTTTPKGAVSLQHLWGY